MGKKANGESTIYRDAAGRWHGYVSMGLKDNGLRDRRHMTGLGRAEVVRKVRALETKRDAGTAEAAGRAPTVATWLDHWLGTIAARRVRPRTWSPTGARSGCIWCPVSATTGSTGSSPSTWRSCMGVCSTVGSLLRLSSGGTGCCPGR